MRKRFVLIIILFSLFFTGNAVAMNYNTIKKAYEKSFTFEKNRDYSNAIKAIWPVFENYPNGYTVNLRLGWLYYLMNKYGTSKYYYDRAIKISPYSIEAKLGLSLPLMAMEKWEEVSQLMYKVIKVDYYNYYGNLRLSISLRKLNNLSNAEKIARKMLTRYPTDVTFLNELAIILYDQGKTSFAKAIFGDVLILDPENTTAKKYLSKIK